jgi:broad specificity phosphatase PhoE
MLKIILIRPGSTDFDEQGRIKGTLNVPLNRLGQEQVARTVDEMFGMPGMPLKAVYCSPCQYAVETAEVIAAANWLKAKPLPELRNLDHGLWHGKRIEEVRRCQPKVYRQWQENPESVCPPEGEQICAMQTRIAAALTKLHKKHKDGIIALVVPEPLASAVRSQVMETTLGDLWKVECDAGGWEVLELAAAS